MATDDFNSKPVAQKWASTTELLAYLVPWSAMTQARIERDPKKGFPTPMRVQGKKFYPIAEVETWLESQRGN